MLELSLQLMFYGMIGVFSTLMILYLAVRLIAKVFPVDEE